VIAISEYIALNPPIPNIWGKSGNLRYPVWYSSLEELGIDLARLPPFAPLPSGGLAERTSAEGMSAMAARPIVPPESRSDDWRRLDAILAQLDRVPDLPAPFEPLGWDEHGLPR
jgi:hypothetical protein